MAMAKSITEARANRTHRVRPGGRENWISRFFESSAETPDRPMGFLVEKKPHDVVDPHFHEVNQFQVIAGGYGRMGKMPVEPFTLHYTNGYTGYGPIVGEDEGIAFFTLRNRWDPGAKYFSNSRHLMKKAPRRHRVPGLVPVSDEAAMKARTEAALDVLIEPEDDGLAAWVARVPPGGTAEAPDPKRGGGQYLIVAGGTMLHDGEALPRLSCAYVGRDETPMTLQAGPDGLEVMIAQFPKEEAWPTESGAA
jgi:hypothetical protein